MYLTLVGTTVLKEIKISKLFTIFGFHSKKRDIDNRKKKKEEQRIPEKEIRVNKLYFELAHY